MDDDDYDEFGNYIGGELEDDSEGGEDSQGFDDDDVPFMRDEAKGDMMEPDDEGDQNEADRT